MEKLTKKEWFDRELESISEKLGIDKEEAQKSIPEVSSMSKEMRTLFIKGVQGTPLNLLK